MAIALVGTAGAVSTGAVGAAVTPVFGTGESRAAGNLLICWAVGQGTGIVTAGGITTPTGNWILLDGIGGNTASYGSLWWCIATGGDAAPTFSATANVVIQARVAEFSGTASTRYDHSGNVTASTSPVATQNLGVDTSTGYLILTCFSAHYTTAATKTFTPTLNNGTLVSLTDSATSTTNHYHFGYAFGTANAAADLISMAFTTTTANEATVSIASFAPGVPAVGPRGKRLDRGYGLSQAVHSSVSRCWTKRRSGIVVPRLWTPEAV